MMANKNLSKKIEKKKNEIRSSFQSVKSFDFASMDFSEAGTWPSPIKIVVITIICGMILFFGNSIHLDSMKKKLNSVSREENVLLGKVSEYSYVDPTAYDYKNQLIVLNESLKEMSSQLPEKIEMSSILDEMTKLASKNGVLIASISLEKEEDTDNYIELPFKIEAQGKYHNFAAFLSELSKIERILTIHDVVIKPNNEDSLLSMQLVAKTYRYKKLETINTDTGF
jgi:type IV pilus assembly protein PilO